MVFIIATFISVISYSQKTFETYYDYQWKKCMIENARFNSMCRNTDSGWYRNDYFINLKKLQMVGLYEDKENTIANGTFYYFYPNGTLKSSGRYNHNKKTDLWLTYFQDKSLKDSLNYKDGNLIGISLSWYSNGYIRDSVNVDQKGNGVYVSWFDDGNPSSAGKYVDFGKKHGKWQYFHKNNQLSCYEIYDRDELKDKKYFDENGKPLNDTTSHNSEAYFPGGNKGWSKYLAKNLFFPSNYEIQNNSQIIVVVSGTVTDEGKIIDIEVSVPVAAAFDKIALDALRKSPNWIPAVLNNRKVYSSFSQSVIFSQSYN